MKEKSQLQIFKTAFDKIKSKTLDDRLAAALDEIRSGLNTTHGRAEPHTPEAEQYSPEATLYIVLITGIEIMRSHHPILPTAQSHIKLAEPQPVRCKTCDKLQTSPICEACREELEDPDTPFTM